MKLQTLIGWWGWVVSGTGVGRAAFHCYPVLKVVIGWIPFPLSGRKWWLRAAPKTTTQIGKVSDSPGFEPPELGRDDVPPPPSPPLLSIDLLQHHDAVLVALDRRPQWPRGQQGAGHVTRVSWRLLKNAPVELGSMIVDIKTTRKNIFASWCETCNQPLLVYHGWRRLSYKVDTK